MAPIHLHALDYAIVALYFVVILLIGVRLRRRMTSSSEYFQAGRALPSWITGLAFVAANCGALEIMGVVSTAAKYGARANQFYWFGAIPAMLFLALFMMPVYYRSRVRSVPEFLKVRYNEATRAVNAISFAVLTILTSGISLYAMAIVLRSFLGWSFGSAIAVSAVVVLVYVTLGGLTATIYNEVLQFLLIVAGLAPLSFLVVKHQGSEFSFAANLPADMLHTWKGVPLMNPSGSPMDIVGIVFGLGFVLSFGYWCTDFLLIQRALAAKDAQAAEQTPVIASVAKLFFPFLVVVPGLAAAALFPSSLAQHYDLALPALMGKFYGPGLLGVGVVAMLSSFMSGMAGNITAFNTVWTYDLYQTHIAPRRPDEHYLRVGRVATVVATVLSVATAYIVLRFNSLMDYVQLLFSFFNAPLLATFLMGMFTRWATPAGGFWGLIAGTLAAVGHRVLVSAGFVQYGSDMSANFYGAICGFTVCLFMTGAVSRFTARRPSEQLDTIVYDRRTFQIRKPILLAIAAVLCVCVALNIYFY